MHLTGARHTHAPSTPSHNSVVWTTNATGSSFCRDSDHRCRFDTIELSYDQEGVRIDGTIPCELFVSFLAEHEIRQAT